MIYHSQPSCFIVIFCVFLSLKLSEILQEKQQQKLSTTNNTQKKKTLKSLISQEKLSENLRGGDLFTVLDHNPLPISSIRNISFSICYVNSRRKSNICFHQWLKLRSYNYLNTSLILCTWLIPSTFPYARDSVGIGA